MVLSKAQTYTLSEGIELSFTDGGPPPNSVDYTTLFVVHGTAFNAYQFKKLHEHAHAFNFRVVTLHRRDHAGSTPYSPSELEEIQQSDRVFWERISAQLAELLKSFIEHEDIPKPTVTEGRRSGGIALMGWSFGCATVLALLGLPENSRISDNELHNFLSQYIGDFILYDPPFLALGYPVSPDGPNYSPWLDPNIAPADFPAIFGKWVGSYYDHYCYDSTTRSLSTLASIHDLDGVRPHADKEEEISTTFWTEEELTKGIEPKPGVTEVSL
ncbi:hypothetical protein GYMLUDRAFT_152793 [Collybiopsis luxurians FD-317 M1]|nr:hypothetical protein GYMLUDRAFT_152793 [Collybiopsis luxurians FD-317 M1]